MIRNSVLAVAALLAFGNAALAADFSGSWTGTGTAGNGTQSMACSPMVMDIAQTATSLSITKAEFSCGEGVTISWTLQDIEIKNGGLFLGDISLGSITDTLINFNYQNADMHWYFSLEQVGGTLVFHDAYIEGTDALYTDGTFTRQ